MSDLRPAKPWLLSITPEPRVRAACIRLVQMLVSQPWLREHKAAVNVTTACHLTVRNYISQHSVRFTL